MSGINNCITKLKETSFVAVIRAKDASQAVKIANACIDGGVKIIEITFTVPEAQSAIYTLCNEYKGSDILIGAGTVLNVAAMEEAVQAGSEFIVSPYLNTAVAQLCIALDLLYMPGAMTLTETVHCIEAGASVVKIFPGELYGPAVIKAFKSPMPHLQLMPTGGVTLANVYEWINAGAVAVGVGANLTSGAKTGNYAAITLNARMFLHAIRNAKGL